MAQKRHVNYVLTPKAIDAAKPRDKAYSISDGGGLLVEVMPGGSKVWRYKYHRDGKREKVTIGPYPSWSIKAARDRHEELREQLHKGGSPAREKRRESAERKAAESSGVSFQAFAQRWVDETLFYRSEGYRAQIIRWLDAYVHPEIGGTPLNEVTPADVLRIMERRLDTPTTADRIRVIIQQIYNFAIRKLLVSTNPAQPLRGAVSVPPKQHHRHLSEQELGAFWRAVGEHGAHATTVLASRLLMLTMVRKGELIAARWSEFDLVAGHWDIPAERMKMRRPHRVFLSRQALEFVQELRSLTFLDGESGYVLPSIYKRKVHMADVTLNHFFKRMDFGVPDFSPHGTRGTAATLLREHGFGRDVVELLLAHAERDQTVAAYSHMDLAPDRKRALQFLADRIDRLALGAEVVPLRA